MANNEIIEEMKKKVFYSSFSGTECIFVDSIDNLSEQQLNDKTACYFDGINLIDNVKGFQDDISKVYSITNQGRYVNLQDYYSRHGAYNDNSEEFLEAIKKLKDKESVTSASNYIEDIQDEEVIKLLNDSIDEFNLSVRTSNCLKTNNVRTIIELIKKTEEELSKTRNFGARSLSEIKNKLYELGLSLGMKNRNNS